jgi:hypothetical protein
LYVSRETESQTGTDLEATQGEGFCEQVSDVPAYVMEIVSTDPLVLDT